MYPGGREPDYWKVFTLYCKYPLTNIHTLICTYSLKTGGGQGGIKKMNLFPVFLEVGENHSNDGMHLDGHTNLLKGGYNGNNFNFLNTKMKGLG